MNLTTKLTHSARIKTIDYEKEKYSNEAQDYRKQKASAELRCSAWFGAAESRME